MITSDDKEVMSASIRKISSFKRRRGSLERVPVLPIHEKYAESRHEGQDLDPFDDIIGRLPQNLFCFAQCSVLQNCNFLH